jgi:hypothetical protein
LSPASAFSLRFRCNKRLQLMVKKKAAMPHNLEGIYRKEKQKRRTDTLAGLDSAMLLADCY